MGIEIKSLGGKTLYVAEGAADVKAALQEAVAVGANLDGANLRGANLRGADLRGANLGGAYLRRADLRGADLGGADLRRANLRGADLGGADLRGADLGDEVWEQVARRLEVSLIAMNDEGRHWIKGSLKKTLEDGSQAYCSIGSVAAHSEGMIRELSLWIVGMVAGGSIPAFNDHPDTTWEDVTVVFRLAIRHARRFAA